MLTLRLTLTHRQLSTLSRRLPTPPEECAGWTTLALVLMLLLSLAASDTAFAQVVGGGGGGGGGGDITTFLQNLVNLITGTAGKLLAVLAICIVGIGALMGALSLRAAGGVIFGVMLIFSASWIVNQIVA